MGERQSPAHLTRGVSGAFARRVRCRRGGQRDVNHRGILALPAILVLATAAATTGVAAQSSGPSAEPAASGAAGAKCNGEHVKYELSFIPNVQHAGFLTAAAEGYYADEGLDVEFIPGGQGVDPTQDLPAGAADMAQV